MARSGMNVFFFLTNHPRRWASVEQTPLSERQRVWEVSVKILEQQNMVQSNPQLKQFAWQGAYFLHWHVIIHILDSLRASPRIEDAAKTWQLIEKIYENNSYMIEDTRNAIHVAVGNLCLKAYIAREAALQIENIRLPPAPLFILQLRQQRELAKAKRQVRAAKMGRLQSSFSHSQENARDEASRTNAGIYLGENSETALFQKNAISQSSDPANTGCTTEADPFWFSNGCDSNQAGNVSAMMNMNSDRISPRDYTMEDIDTQPITWEQWDAWLAESNVMRPLFSE
jgi:hypothetical protein